MKYRLRKGVIKPSLLPLWGVALLELLAIVFYLHELESLIIGKL